MGIDDDINGCVSHAHSKAMLESVVCHIVEPDDGSREMCHHTIASIFDRPPMYVTPRFAYCMARKLMGDDLADVMQLPKSKFGDIQVGMFLAMLRWSVKVVPSFLLQKVNKNRVEFLVHTVLGKKSLFKPRDLLNGKRQLTRARSSRHALNAAKMITEPTLHRRVCGTWTSLLIVFSVSIAIISVLVHRFLYNPASASPHTVLSDLFVL
jgi:hypothetical protein